MTVAKFSVKGAATIHVIDGTKIDTLHILLRPCAFSSAALSCCKCVCILISESSTLTGLMDGIYSIFDPPADGMTAEFPLDPKIVPWG